MRSLGRKGLLLAVLVAVMINLPLLHSRYTMLKIDRSGVDVSATVVDHTVLSPGSDAQYFVQFVLPKDIDADQTNRTVRVEKATYTQALADGVLGVRVLADEPSAFRADGQVIGPLGLILTLIFDVVLLLLLVLALRFRGHLRAELRLVATQDLAPSGSGALLDRVEGDRYVVSGDIAAIEGDEADEIVLDLGDRRVRVLLDGHQNLVGPHGGATVTGRLIG